MYSNYVQFSHSPLLVLVQSQLRDSLHMESKKDESNRRTQIYFKWITSYEANLIRNLCLQFLNLCLQ